jgi:hypothetical protein
LEKAGYYGPYSLVKDQIRVTTYESSKITLTFEEYETFKKSVVNGDSKK